MVSTTCPSVYGQDTDMGTQSDVHILLMIIMQAPDVCYHPNIEIIF